MSDEREKMELRSIPNVKLDFQYAHARLLPCEFSILTPGEVNDFIATKVMGYTLDVLRPLNGKKYTATGTNPGIGSWSGNIVFDPYHSLDDCHKVEENIKAMSSYCKQPPFLYRWDGYCDILMDILDVGGYESEHNYPKLIVHATAAQKCEAILRAMGIVK